MNQFTFDLNDEITDHGFTMAVSERPQTRLENFGANAVSDTELLAMILQGNGASADKAVNLASRIIAEAGSIGSLAFWGQAEYRQIKGIGTIKGLQLVALAEIARRMATAQRPKSPVLNRASLVAEFMAPTAAGLQVEKFWVLCLNRKSRLIKQVEISSGTATSALAHPREVFRAAIREMAASIVCIHNHPSGDPVPSAPDIHVTRLLREAARAVDIELLDHVILGRCELDPTGVGYYSFRQAGLL